MRVAAAHTEVAGAPPELSVLVAADQMMLPEVSTRVVAAQTEVAAAPPELSVRVAADQTAAPEARIGSPNPAITYLVVDDGFVFQFGVIEARRPVE